MGLSIPEWVDGALAERAAEQAAQPQPPVLTGSELEAARADLADYFIGWTWAKYGPTPPASNGVPAAAETTDA